ncbi:MAG: O-antigen ligase family protein [Hyphomicrobium sp.]|nr:O-antigen ligase family protein [Hyphomicrobium sp.]
MTDFKGVPTNSLIGALLEPSRLLVAVACYAVFAIFFPRFAPVITLIVLCVGLLAAAAVEGLVQRRRLAWIGWGPVAKSATLLIGIFLAGCAWSADPVDGLIKTAILASLLVSGLVITTLMERMETPALKGAAAGLALGLALGSIYVLVNTVTDREIERLTHDFLPFLREGFEGHYPTGPDGRVIQVSPTAFNRTTCAFALLILPAMLAAWIVFKGRLRLIVVGLLLVAAAAVFFNSAHQSSQLAFVFGALTLAVALRSLNAAKWLVTGAIVATFVLIVPFGIWAERTGLHMEKQVPFSARARLVYWSYTAEQITKRPLLGVGTAATASLDEARRETWEKPKGYVVPRRTSTHPHNVYLQILYEIGILGALAVTIFAATLIWKAAELPARVAPFAVAQAAVAAAMVLPSYGLWQTWLQAVIGASAIAIWLIGIMARREPQDVQASTTP